MVVTMTNKESKVCAKCIYWRKDQWIMNKYGEDFGICTIDGSIRLCSHKCPFCEQKYKEE